MAFMYGVSGGVLEIKQNEMWGGGSILIYAPQPRPHIGPIHSHYTHGTRLKYPHTGWSSTLMISCYPEFWD